MSWSTATGTRREGVDVEDEGQRPVRRAVSEEMTPRRQDSNTGSRVRVVEEEEGEEEVVEGLVLPSSAVVRVAVGEVGVDLGEESDEALRGALRGERSGEGASCPELMPRVVARLVCHGIRGKAGND
jgi:hypothetical protein